MNNYYEDLFTKAENSDVTIQKNTTFYLYEKASNKSKLRVLYKQNGKNPKVRIIPNVQILKRAIVNRTLDIIPYQNVFLICNNHDYMKATPINVVFDLFHISGDLLVVKINNDKAVKKRYISAFFQ